MTAKPSKKNIEKLRQYLNKQNELLHAKPVNKPNRADKPKPRTSR